MISRMILVGLVAVLGVSLPSRSESGGWLTSAHAWAIAQLAEWDTYTPAEDEDLCSLVTEAPDSSPREATQTATPTNTLASIAIEPIPVDDDLCTGLADELNGMAEGLDAPPTTTASAELPADFVPVSASDSIELKLAVELCRIAEDSARDEPVSSPAIPQTPETNTDPAIDAIFADVSQVFAPPEQALATSAQPKPVLIAVGPKFEPVQSLVDLAMDTYAKWNRFVEGIPIRLEDAAAFPSRLVQTQAFEPIEVPTDLESEIADELNRESEGLDIVSPEPRRFGDAQPQIPGNETAPHPEGHRNHGDASIGKALSLTRDAALAWMNVLTGMTPVSITSQSE